MAKEFEDKFFDELKQGVVDDRTELEKRKDEILKAIEELESNVIKDPKALENLKKELAKLDKEIKKEEAEKAVESGEMVGKGASEKDKDDKTKEEEEKQEEIKDEKDLNKEEKEKKEQEEVEKLQAYHDKMVALHEARMASITSQKQKGNLVIGEEDFKNEMRLESELYTARNLYISLGKADPYATLRTEYIKQEKIAREQSEMQLRNMAKRFVELEKDIREIDERVEEINKELMKDGVSEVQVKALNKEREELLEKRKVLDLARAEIREKLEFAIDTKRQREKTRAKLEYQYRQTLDKGDMKSYKYQQGKTNTMYKNFDDATRQHYENVKERIEEREQRIKELNKELKELDEVAPTNFERKLNLLNELDKEKIMLDADKEAKEDLDRGVEPNEVMEKREIYAKAETEKQRQKEFDEATKEVREAVEIQNKQIGEESIQNTSVIDSNEREKEINKKAMVVAAVYDDPNKAGPDTFGDNVKQTVVAKCVIEGLEDQVRDPNKLEDAQAILQHDEKITEAKQEIAKVQKDIEQKM